MSDTIVIGSGLAGLTAAIRLSQAGQSVTLLSFGMGGIQLGQGTIDVLGYGSTGDLIKRPFDQLADFTSTQPGHPYNQLNQVKTAIDWFADLLLDLLEKTEGENQLVPTALGAMRPTYLVQPSMVWPEPDSVAIVGPRQIKDFYPDLVAANLAKTAQVKAIPYHIDLPARSGEVDSSPVNYAKALDNQEFLNHFADQLEKLVSDEAAVCLPAILGLHTPAHQYLSQVLKRPVVEALVGPPSIPGMRLNIALTEIAQAGGVRIIFGSKVSGFQADRGTIQAVILHQAGYDKAYRADNFVYAGGGFESGALAMDSYGQVSETVFDLPLRGLDQDLITGDYWGDQKLFAVGVGVDSSMRPLDLDGHLVYQNLYAVGGLLASAIRWSEKSGDGIAVASAFTAANHILGAGAPAWSTDNEGSK